MSRPRHPRQLAQRAQWFGLLCVCVVITAGAAWFIERQVTGLVLAQVLARAVDQVELGLLPRVTSADFDPPFTADKLDDLSTRLEPMLARIQEQSSGVIRVNVFARDGTVVYSDLPSLRGQVVSPLSDQLLREALAGSAKAEMTPLLSGPENGDLGPRYGGALEAYVPCVLGGRVAGAYEVYVDLAAIRPIRSIVWTSTAVVFGVPLLAMLLLGRGRGRLGRPARPAQASARPTVPVALAMGAVRLPPGDQDGQFDAEAPAGMVGAQAPTERWLTRREMEVLRLLATHRTYRQIASELLLSEETVRSHVKHILRKLDEPDRSHAVETAVRAGLLPD